MIQTQVFTRRLLTDLLVRLALPFVLFAIVFLSFLLVSWVLILPAFTQVTVSGEKRDPQEIAEYAASLKADIHSLEQERSQRLLPSRGDLYDQLTEEKKQQHSLLALREAIASIAVHLLPDIPHAVRFGAFSYESETKTVYLQGQVEHVGPRSMTVLAQFIDALENLPFVESIAPIPYKRSQDDEGNFSSPFELTITLQNAS